MAVQQVKHEESKQQNAYTKVNLAWWNQNTPGKTEGINSYKQ